MKDFRIDFKSVASAALRNIDGILAAWVPGGKRHGAEYVARNPVRNDEREGSFSINLSTGVWSDFATDEKGGDLVSLVAYLDSVTQSEACKRLAQHLGLQEVGAGKTRSEGSASTKINQPVGAAPGLPVLDWVPVMPVPDEALASCPVVHKGLGRPSSTWEYRSAEGKLLLKVMRFDVADEGGRRKEYRPLTYCRSASGKFAWMWKQPTENRPLYGLDVLSSVAPGSVVLLCEGEKATDAARLLLPGTPVLAWLSGSKAIGKVDFSPLSGRTVWYWPDNDKAGHDSIAPLDKALHKLGARFSTLDLSMFSAFIPSVTDGCAALSDATRREALPEKWDAADALLAGWTSEHISLLIEKGLVQKESGGTASASSAGATASLPGPGAGRYRSDESGLFFFDMKTESYRPIGGRLDVLARSRNADNRSWGLLVSFSDMDGHKREWNIPSALFATEGGAEVVRGLLDRGYTLLTNREAKRHLIEYLGDYATVKRVRLVERMGWFDGAFLLPDRVIGTPAEDLHYYSDAPALCRMATSGSLAEWREMVAEKCVENSLPTFAVCAALAGPLLDVLNSETCGFHFVGDSSLGKSTLLKIAASVYGHPGYYPRTWRSTDNALEATASAHSDCLLVLDEIGQIDPRIVGETVYMLGNGEGKSRATESGRARGVEHRWRLVFLSSGEKTLQDHMAEANKKPQAGMEARLLTIPANVHKDSDARIRLGIFENDRGFAGGAELSSHFMSCCEKFHGEPILEFIKSLTSDAARARLIGWFSEHRQQYESALLGAGAGGQVRRAVDKFAIVAAAGEWATEYGITGWPEGWATKASQTCFRNWLAHRGGEGNLEDKQSLDHVRLMLNKYGESKFTRWDSEDARIDEHAPRTMDRWGFRKTKDSPHLYEGGTSETLYYMTGTGFTDMCTGHDPKRIARLLHDAGVLDTDREPGRLTKKVRLPGVGQSPVNCYVIRLSVLLSE